MTTSPADKNQLLADFARLVSQAQVDHLRALGLDILEGRREGAYVFDQDGRRYIDCHCSAGIFNLGRRPPEIIAALRQTMAEADQGNFPMISREKARLASMLAEFVPGELECSVFSVVRGESFDFACKLARGATGRRELAAPDGSWFGQTGFALSLSERADKNDFAPLVPDCRLIPFDDIAEAKRAVTTATAAVFLEPIQAENHCRRPAKEYLRELQDHCRAVGALLVLDETQTGLGRTGRRFAYEHFQVEPDVLIIGEALGAGVFPIAATMFTQRLNAFMNAHPLIHLSTFGGSDLGCLVAAKALEVYRQNRPWENALRMGRKLKEQIEQTADRSAIRDVAGEGLLLSIKLENENKAVEFNRCLAAAGVLAMPGMVAKNTVVLRPSLTVSPEDIEAIAAAVSTAAAQMR